MTKVLKVQDLPADVLVNISSFLFGKPWHLKLKHSEAFKEYQRTFKTRYTDKNYEIYSESASWIYDVSGREMRPIDVDYQSRKLIYFLDKHLHKYSHIFDHVSVRFDCFLIGTYFLNITNTTEENKKEIHNIYLKVKETYNKIKVRSPHLFEERFKGTYYEPCGSIRVCFGIHCVRWWANPT